MFIYQLSALEIETSETMTFCFMLESMNYSHKMLRFAEKQGIMLTALAQKRIQVALLSEYAFQLGHLFWRFDL